MASPTGISFWQHIENYPPIVVRLLAKKRVSGPRTDSAYSHAEIAIRSRIPLERVRYISRLMDWGPVSMGEMRAFFEACNFDPTVATDRQRVKKYICKLNLRKIRDFHYLTSSPYWESEFLPLVKILQAKEGSDSTALLSA